MQLGSASRRQFLKLASAAVLTLAARGAAEAVGPMKITKVEAVRFLSDRPIQGIAPNWMWVRLHTDKGLVGIGESYPGYDAHRGANEVSFIEANLGLTDRASPLDTLKDGHYGKATWAGRHGYISRRL